MCWCHRRAMFDASQMAIGLMMLPMTSALLAVPMRLGLSQRVSTVAMKLAVGDVAPPSLCQTINSVGERAVIFALQDPVFALQQALDVSQFAELDFKVVVLSQFAETTLPGASCFKAPPSSSMRLGVQQICEDPAFSFVLDKTGTVRAVCSDGKPASNVREVLSVCKEIAAAAPTDGEAEVIRAAAEREAAELAQQRAVEEAVNEEERLLELVRSRRPPRPTILRGVNKLRWEEEERKAVEEERRKMLAGTPEEAAMKRQANTTTISRAVFVALLLGVAAFVQSQQQ